MSSCIPVHVCVCAIVAGRIFPYSIVHDVVKEGIQVCVGVDHWYKDPKSPSFATSVNVHFATLRM
jgi:hypothetical protein